MLWTHILYIALTFVFSLLSLCFFRFPSFPFWVSILLFLLSIQEIFWIKQVIEREIKEAKTLIEEIKRMSMD